MAFANNRAASKPRATFQVAGGTICKYRHPFLAGQINDSTMIDEVDVSRAMRLNTTFLNARPANNNSIQEVLVDGSIITITNHVMAGILDLEVLRTTGLVGTGDLIACAQLIISSKDDVGGTFTVIETIDGKRIVTIFYGVSWANVPHMIKAGNAVVPYPVQMLYAGFVQGVSANTEINAKTIWAVGNKVGISAIYKPYGIQESENPDNYFGGNPLSATWAGRATDADSPDGDLTDAAGNTLDIAAVPDPVPVNMVMSDPETRTWESA